MKRTTVKQLSLEVRSDSARQDARMDDLAGAISDLNKQTRELREALFSCRQKADMLGYENDAIARKNTNRWLALWVVSVMGAVFLWLAS